MKNVFRNLKKKFNSRTTSKYILIVIFIYILILTPFVIFIALKGNTEPFVKLIDGAFMLASIAVGFYYWKAKAENIRKYGNRENITMNGE